MFGYARKVASVVIPGGLTGDEKFPVLMAPASHKVTIEKATMILNDDISGSTASYATYVLLNGGTAGTATTAIGTAGGTAGFTQYVPEAFTLADGSGQLDEGEVLVLSMDITGSVTAPDATLVIEYVDGLGSTRNS